MLALDAYIAADNPVAAEQVVDFIISQAEYLTRFPLLGRIPKAGAPRELILNRHPYNIIYRITRSKIRIVRVIHQSRLYP
ncbi:MAG: type II toxin-antitoxin system RelE/ParE family toxin [Nitrosomonadales bacterium]|nr:type II toxin-antitoxin system RelE/ParE family toxin [Nitrosomonadales bacterium]